jgi:predicted Zn finger-like uncharacterized protein
MNLTCPSCATTFVVETEQLGPSGRKVRCGSCGHSWHQAPENGAGAPAAPATAPAAAPPEPAPAAPREKVEKRDRRRGPKPPREKLARNGGSSLLLGWLLFLVVIGGLAAGLYFGREQVLALVPQAAPLYQMAGLMPPPADVPLELRDVKTARRVVDGVQVVVVEGLVSNVTNEPQSIPMLRASLIDAKGDEVGSWTFAASATTLPPGGATGFETTTKNPPSEGRILIDFVATP